MQKVDRIVAEQVEYYRARAAEYDQYYERAGPFDRGPEENHAWLDELAQVRDALRLEPAWTLAAAAPRRFFVYGRATPSRRASLG